MSNTVLISQLADVLEEIAAERKRRFADISELRKGAVSAVAEKYKREERTIADGFIRRLRPEISSTDEFDRALNDWIKSKSDKLQRALLAHIGSGPDAVRVFQALDSLKGPSGYDASICQGTSYPL